MRGFLKDPGFASLFPAGIFEFHRFNQWPNTPFEYRRPKVLTDSLLAVVRDNREIPEMLAALRGVAYLYFGRRDAPLDFSQSLYPLRRAAQRELVEGRERMRDIESLRTGWDVHRDEYLQQVDRVLSAFDRLKYLEGVDYAKTRLVKDPKIKILSLESVYIERLRSDEYYLAWRRERSEPEDWRDTWLKSKKRGPFAPPPLSSSLREQRNDDDEKPRRHGFTHLHFKRELETHCLDSKVRRPTEPYKGLRIGIRTPVLFIGSDAMRIAGATGISSLRVLRWMLWRVSFCELCFGALGSVVRCVR